MADKGTYVIYLSAGITHKLEINRIYINYKYLANMKDKIYGNRLPKVTKEKKMLGIAGLRRAEL
jgi:hypothetical protein